MPRKKTVTKRPAYRDAVRWVAFEDNAGSGDGHEEIQYYISTLLVADLFGADPRCVATDILRTRNGVGPFADSDA